MTQETLDVLPHPRLERVGPQRAARAAALDRSARLELSAAAIPGGVTATLRAEVGQTARPAAHDSAQEVDPAGVLGADAIAGEGRLGRFPQLDRDEWFHRRADDGPVLLLGPLAEGQFASIGGQHEQVAHPSRFPRAAGLLAADATPIVGVLRHDAEPVEFVGHALAAPALESHPAIHAADDVGG